jgi:hypothetical protein
MAHRALWEDVRTIWIFSYTFQILRDGFDQAAGNRRLETTSCHLKRGEQDSRLQEGVSVHLCVGDPRPSAVGRRLYQRQHPQCEFSLEHVR